MADRFLEGRVAVITGAGKGIGRAIALALAGAGAKLVLSDLTAAQVEETRKLAADAGAQCEAFGCDVREESQVRSLAEQVMQRFGGAHILVNNAGTAIRKKIHEFSLAEWRTVMETNLTGPFLMCRYFVPHMKGHGYGRIINLTSIMAHVSSDGRGIYSASKHGLLGLTRALALELADDGSPRSRSVPASSRRISPRRCVPTRRRALRCLRKRRSGATASPKKLRHWLFISVPTPRPTSPAAIC